MLNPRDTVAMLATNIVGDDLPLESSDRGIDKTDPGYDLKTENWYDTNGEVDNRPASTHPMQPLVEDEHGVIRFKKNAIIAAMLDRDAEHGGQNKIAYEVVTGKHTHEDYSQLMQLIGYSVGGYGDLTIVPKADRVNADAMAEAFMATLPRYKKEPSA